MVLRHCHSREWLDRQIKEISIKWWTTLTARFGVSGSRMKNFVKWLCKQRSNWNELCNIDYISKRSVWVRELNSFDKIEHNTTAFVTGRFIFFWSSWQDNLKNTLWYWQTFPYFPSAWDPSHRGQWQEVPAWLSLVSFIDIIQTFILWLVCLLNKFCIITTL